MYILTEDEYLKEAEPLLRRIFVKDDPYDAPFSDNVERKILLYEYWYEMEGPLLEVIFNTSLVYGDTGFYVSVLDRPAQQEQVQPYHWYISFKEIDQYRNLVGPLQNVVYSSSGLWAIMGSDEHHGLLGGHRGFVERIIDSLPHIENQVHDFLKYWVENKVNLRSDVSWMPGLLENLYGIEMAKELLSKYSLLVV